jgi:serine protease Do
MMLLAAALMAALTAAVPAGAGLSPAQAYREIYDRYRDSVVPITYTLRPKEKPTGGEGRKVEDAVCGVIVTDDGLIVTTADPFPDQSGDPRTTLSPVDFKVRLRGGRPLDAEAVGLDRDKNLAFLRLKNPPQDLHAPRFDPGAALQIGDEVVVLGLMSKEYDYLPIFHTAVVNAIVERPRLMYSVDLYIQDLSIGGLVVSRAGVPVGIVGEDLLKDQPTGEKMPPNALSILGAFAHGVPVGYPMVFPYSLLAAGIASPPSIEAEEKRSWLGIVMQPLNEDLIEYWKLDVEGGIIISSVVEGSPAEKAGLQPADMLVALQGEPLRITKDEDLGEFRRRIERMGVGTQVDLVVLRRGERRNVSLPLGEAPKTAWTAAEFKDDDLGLTVREITIDDLQGQNLDPDTRGVVVVEMEQAGWSQLAGLQVGDIIQTADGHPVTDLASFRSQSERLHEEKPEGTVLFVLRQTETLFVRIRTSWEKPR